MHLKCCLKPVTLVAGVILLGQSLTAYAEAVPPASQRPMQEIVVTASKEGEVSPQRLPMALSVFDSESLATNGADNIEDLKAMTPGLNISRNGQAARLYMRGIGTNLDFVGADPSVTVHVDGVYMARPTSVLESFLDVERVEVLRGPQGTLYGRNSIGGTVNIISKLPQKEASAKASLELGSFNYTSVAASASGALGSDGVLGRFAIMKTDHDPYVDNVSANGVDGLLDDDSLYSRGALRILLNSSSELIVRLDYARTDRATGAYKPTGLTTVGEPSPYSDQLNEPSDDHEMRLSFDSPFVDQTNVGSSLEYQWDIDSNLSLTSITGYRELDYHAIEDTDGSSVDAFVTDIDDDQEQFSEELRLNYRQGDFKLIGGFYYFYEEHTSDTVLNRNDLGLRLLFDVASETNAYALFANGSWAFSDATNLSLGARYSEETKDFDNLSQAALPTTTVPRYDIAESETWQSFSPKLAIDHQTAAGALLFGSVSRGFKTGGYNFTYENAAYEPEYVTAYEAGIKKDWPSQGLRTNLVFFYYDYDDLQVTDFSVPGEPRTTNAAQATAKGFEIENRWMPTLNWLLEMNFAFLDARYDRYTAPDALGTDVSGNILNASPRRSLHSAVQYFQDISRGTVSYRLEYDWQSKQYFTAFNQEVSSQGTYGLFNARIAFTSLDKSWELHLYGENLADKAYATASREFTSNTVGVTKDINPPRTYGAKVVYSFM